ncbi:MAG: arsenite methyltransferase [Bacteroidota bacterium]
MQTNNERKALVKEKYSEIADQSRQQNASSCCGSGCCSEELYNLMADDYTKLEGYHAGADLGLGCGLPTEFAKIKAGDTVIDLGSGAGNDCFVARAITGETGKVIGIDFTEKMIEKARQNAEKLHFHNVEFRKGDIEQMPVSANIADVVVSNCVLNLVPNKYQVLQEVYRVLKPGGHFSIADIVLEGSLPLPLKEAAEMYAGCVSGAIQKQVYLELIEAAGFRNISIQKEKIIRIPDDILINYISEEDIALFRNSKMGIFSITVYAEKPLEIAPCCEPGCCGN